MKNKNLFAIFSSFCLTFALSALFGVQLTHASTIPTLSLSVVTPGYTQITVYGDPNSAVLLYYSNSTIGGAETETTGSLGSTNQYGYFSTSLNDATYNIPYNTEVYVNVDGQNSAQALWPNYYSNGSGSGTGTNPPQTGGLVLSQTNINLQLEQTTAITVVYNNAYNANYSYPYGTLTVTSNTNPSAVSTIVVGNQVNVTGVNYGSATLTICESGINICGTVYVTVGSPTTFPTQPYPYQPYPSYPYPYFPTPITSPISFGTNGNNVSMNAGSSQNIQIYGSGNYYIYQNANPAVVTANISGGQLSLYAIQAGTSNITVCENISTVSCAQLFVDVMPNQQTSYWQFPYNSFYPW